MGILDRLFASKSTRAAEPLVRMLRAACDKKQELTAADLQKALTATGDAAIAPLEAAIAEAKDESDPLVFRGMQAVGLMQSPAASAMLIRKLKDDRKGVRQYAAMYLGNFSDPASARPLIKAMGTDGSTKLAARETLTSLARRHRACVEALKEALTHDDATIKSNAMGILLELGEMTPLVAINARRGKTPAASALEGPLFRVKISARGSDGHFASRCAFIDQHGVLVLEPKYSVAGDFSEGLAWVTLETRGVQRYGYIDETGALVIGPSEWLNANDFSSGLALVSLPRGEGWTFIDRQGRTALSNKDWKGLSSVFREGKLMAMVGDHWGYIDTKGHWVIEPRFDECMSFSEGLACGRRGGAWEIITASGEVVGTLKANKVGGSFSEGLIGFTRDGKTGFADRNGNVVIAPKPGYGGPFREGLAYFATDGKFGFIDRGGQWVVPATFEDAGCFSEGLAPAKTGGKYGLIDRNGNSVIPPQFTGAESFQNGLARVGLDGEIEIYLDPQGHEVWRWSFEDSKAVFGS
jgi:hypothetical protein